MEKTMNKAEPIRIDLTTDQQRQIKDAIGQDVSRLEFKVEELEQRIAPSDFSIMKNMDKATPILF